jgi:hypothetical protein
MAAHKRLGECLVEANIITQAQLEQALQVQQQRNGCFIGQILLEMGLITDKQLCLAISQALHVNCINIESVLITDDVIALIPASLAATCKILPLFVHGNTLYLAMANPRDTGAIQLVEFSTGMTVRPFVVPACQLQEMLHRYYQIDQTLLAEPVGPLPATPSKKPAPDDDTTPNCQSLSSIRAAQHKRLGEILVERELVTMAQINTALHLQQIKSGFLGQILVDMGWISEQKLCDVISESLNVEVLGEWLPEIPSEVVELISESLAVSCNIFPLFVEDHVLYMAMENPMDNGAIQMVEFSTGLQVEPLIASHSQLQHLIRTYYH